MSMSPIDSYNDQLIEAVFELLKGSSHSMTFSETGNSGVNMTLGSLSNPQDSVSFSSQALEALAKGQDNSFSGALSQVAQETSSTGVNQLATAYSNEASQSLSDRFYNETDPSTLTGMMSPDEAASFKAAFANRSLTIQTAAEAGLKATGSWSETFTANGNAGGGDYTIPTSSLNAKYALTSVDLISGGYVVSWGGSKST